MKIFGLFAFCTFLGSGLLFFLELMIAKMYLPHFGGSPEVWLGCVCFFQIAIAVGYYFAHRIMKSNGSPVRLTAYSAVVVGSVYILPVSVPSWISLEALPRNLWLFTCLAFSTGPLTLTITSTSPLLQACYAKFSDTGSVTPYRLYSYSNLGSLFLLLCYPFLIEPFLSIEIQRMAWSITYVVFSVMNLFCIWLAFIRHKNNGVVDTTDSVGESIPWTIKLTWLTLAAVASTLLLSTTFLLTNDLGTFPLLWVLPLAIYLITWILAYSKFDSRIRDVSHSLLPIALVALVSTLSWDTEVLLLVKLTIHLFGLFIIACSCHAELACRQPNKKFLTDYFLMIALGGLLGGIINTVIAPIVFDDLVEYPLTLISVALLSALVIRHDRGDKIPLRQSSLLSLAVMTAIVVSYLATPSLIRMVADTEVGIFESLPISHMLFLPGVTCILVARHRVAFACGIVMLLGLNVYVNAANEEITLHKERTFFGFYRIVEEKDGSGHWKKLWHSTTLHGLQYSQLPWSLTPTTYYTRSGPLGDLMGILEADERPRKIAVVGLGIGTIGSYTRENWQVHYYEIDPEVVRIARDTGHFSYLTKNQRNNHYIIGDARLKLRTAIPDGFDAIIFDAFTSDAIPIHLLTIEALSEYQTKLKPDGILAFHISNRHLDLSPVLANAASKLNWSARGRFDSTVNEQDWINFRKYTSHWVCISRIDSSLAPLGEKWVSISPHAESNPWTDSYSSLFSVLGK